ncbi:MAG: glycosyltransferase family 2 protein [Lachnospiraceae bacterium]|nr:glycosyltransferase family 2 protein [Lachnospiraceae bacterium]
MLGIVILNYQTWEISLRCMQSIADTKQDLACRIYLVDNASKASMPENIRQYIAEHEKEICFIQSPENRGYAAGNNIGIKRALEDGCDTLVITNNDIVFCKDSLQNFIKAFEKHKEVGIIGPKVVDSNGNFQRSRCSMKTGMKEIFQIYTLAKFFCKKKFRAYYCLDQNPDQESYTYHVSGCCFAITAECAKVITPLDEGTMLYYEEPIIGIRMEEAGFKTWYEPKGVVVHKHGATTDGVEPFMFQCICESELYYCSKYLHAKKWQLGLLLHYRNILYRIRSRTDIRLREYYKTYRKATKCAYERAKECPNLR